MVPKRSPATASRSETEDADRRQMRKRRLEAINAELSATGLATWCKLGDHREGEIELVKIVGKHDFRFYWVIVFECIHPDGRRGEYASVTNANPRLLETEDGPVHISGAACVTTLNRERLVLVKQHRPGLSQVNAWPYEIPRGFNPHSNVVPLGKPLRHDADSLPFELDAATVPMGIVNRELAGLLKRQDVRAVACSILGLSPEDTGTSNKLMLVAHIGLETDELDRLVSEVRGTDSMRLAFPTFEEVDRNWYRMGLGALHSAAALHFFNAMVRPHL